MGAQQHQQRTSIQKEQLPKSDFPSRTSALSGVKSYRGIRNPDGTCDVWAESLTASQVPLAREPARKALSLHLELRNHSPTGFEWGYGGSGPAQLALALLMDATNDATLAQRHYQDFKFEVVASWSDSWRITFTEINSFLAARENPAGCQSTRHPCPDC